MMRENLIKKMAAFSMVGLLAAASVLSCAAEETEETEAQTTVETAVEETAVTAEDTAETAETTAEDSYKSTATSLIEHIVGLSEEEISYYTALDDGSFAETAVESWNSSRSELGAYVSITEQEVDLDGTDLTVTSKVQFEENSATVTLTGDLDAGSFTSMSFDVNYTLAQKMQQAGLNTIMGLGVVFVVLFFLCWLIGLMKYIPQPGQKKKEETPAAQSAAPVPEVIEEEEELAGDEELVAVIAAAVAAYEGSTSADGYIVRSIRKSNKNNWRRA